ncbi:MAG: hypothetical protein ACXVC1_01590, partial [Tumebacillaceae bacterium]
MKNLFKIKFAVSLLLTILLTLSLSLPALAAVKSNANVGTVSFLLQGITGDLNLKKVRMVAYVPIKGKTNTFYNTEVATEATMTNTADGYLVTVPNVDWSLTFSYQVLVVTDRYIWPTFATQNIASQGPIKLNTNRFVSVPPSVSVSGKPNFQMDKMAMWLGGDFTDYAFLQEVTPGQSVPNNGYIYRTLVFGHDDDHEYVITANYYSYAPGPLVI